MDKAVLKNSWFLAAVVLIINVVLVLIIVAVVTFFKIGRVSSISGIAMVAGAMILGQVYAMNFKEIMPKKLRINVTITYMLAQIGLGSIYLFMVSVSNYLLFFGILIGISLFYSLCMYWSLGLGGKIYLKSLPKRKATTK